MICQHGGIFLLINLSQFLRGASEEAREALFVRHFISFESFPHNMIASALTPPGHEGKDLFLSEDKLPILLPPRGDGYNLYS